ncbi:MULTISPECIES: DUF2730 family protein [Polycladidibacter]|uniref:DUF2730 family protein n=1 Tax=Polycladidibacter TaxID=2821833 RepID=UPI00082C3F67|nr:MULTISPECIES: DUF2730 family protein [Pseudovibrio]
MWSAEDLRNWLAVSLSTIAIITTIWGWLQTRARDNSGKIERLSERLVKTEGTLKSLERELEHLPSKEAVHQIELTLAEVRGGLNTMATSFESIKRTTERIENHLMESGK